MGRAPRAITLDLDDTLWPVWPAIERAERVLHAWLAEHAPATAQRHDIAALRALRDAAAREHPQWVHDLSRLRRHSIAQALSAAGDDPALAAAAFDVFFAERNRLELYAEVDAALQRLAARFPLLALTNGNADLKCAGVAHHFVGTVSAAQCGVGKPDPRIFAVACERLGLAPHEVLHLGDDWALDVQGARGAGLQAAWLSRAAAPAPADAEPVWTVRDLDEFAAALVTN